MGAAAMRTVAPEVVLDAMAQAEPTPEQVAAEVVRTVLGMTGFTRASAAGLARERLGSPPAGVVMLFLGRQRFAFAIPTAELIDAELARVAEGKTLPARKRIADVRARVLAGAYEAVRAVETRLREGRK